ncbi:NUDIX hydrolase [Butyricicoccus sp.]|uniref:NUDIX hydrolase n=1 Tax=Butyricicoccus sp. TaxID=2049021 RepID=UPI003D7D5FEE
MSPELLERLKKHQSSIIGCKQCKQAAVLIPLMETADGLQIVLEQRSPKLKHQPRDICLPGGAIESGETPQQAAVREACEELLIRSEQIEVLGLMDVLHTNTLMLYPYAAKLSAYAMTYSPAEVEQVFCVPLSFFQTQEPEQYRITLPVHPPENFPLSRIVGGEKYQWRERREDILFYQYRDWTIWGITAKILQSFAQITK